MSRAIPEQSVASGLILGFASHFLSFLSPTIILVFKRRSDVKKQPTVRSFVYPSVNFEGTCENDARHRKECPRHGSCCPEGEATLSIAHMSS